MDAVRDRVGLARPAERHVFSAVKSAWNSACKRKSTRAGAEKAGMAGIGAGTASHQDSSKKQCSSPASAAPRVGLWDAHFE
jgi:hypothetical protein